jgi:hypothetical protein
VGAGTSVVSLTGALGDGGAAAGSGARWQAATAAVSRTAKKIFERIMAPPQNSAIMNASAVPYHRGGGKLLRNGYFRADARRRR